MTDLSAPLVPAEVDRPSLFDACTCMRDGRPCRVCLAWDEQLGWLDGLAGRNSTAATSCSTPTA